MMSSENLPIIFLFSALVFEIIVSVNLLSSLKYFIYSSRSVNKNASFSCTILFFRAKNKTTKNKNKKLEVYHSQVIQVIQ